MSQPLSDSELDLDTPLSTAQTDDSSRDDLNETKREERSMLASIIALHGVQVRTKCDLSGFVTYANCSYRMNIINVIKLLL